MVIDVQSMIYGRLFLEVVCTDCREKSLNNQPKKALNKDKKIHMEVKAASSNNPSRSQQSTHSALYSLWKKRNLGKKIFNTKKYSNF
jgi:hypothetical protein